MSKHLGELKIILRWLFDWPEDANVRGQDLIVHGAIHIDRMGDPLYRGFISIHLYTTNSINLIPHTVWARLISPTLKGYDRIAWFVENQVIDNIYVSCPGVRRYKAILCELIKDLSRKKT